MNVGLVYRDLLPPMVAAELESLTTRIRTGWHVEHDAEGHHVAIAAQTINASGLISAGGDPLQGTATTFARKLRLVYLSNTSAGSEAVGSAVIQQNIATVGSAQGLGSASRAAHPSGVVALLIGGGGGASVIGQGSVTQMRGLLATVHTEQGAGGATDAMALRCDVIGRVSGTGTITNGYGLYINHGTTGITNRWGVYQVTAAASNFLAGPLLMGSPVSVGLSQYFVQLAQSALGTGAVSGPALFIGNNTSGNDAAGTLGIVARGGQFYSIWPDASGNLRISASLGPTEDNTTISDTSGTVVGTQTSSRAFKTDIVRRTDDHSMLTTVLCSPVFDFRLKSGAYNKTFTGLITEESPTFGMDPDDEHPAGKSLDEVTAIGYLFGAIKALHARVSALETA